MSRQLALAPKLRTATIATVFAACPIVAQANSVQTIFSAENALYGAGYSVGQVDGWIDDQLRKAIRRYQSSRTGLGVTGELDVPTLSALGIAGPRSQLVSDNRVASPEAARKELGLQPATLPKIKMNSAPKVSTASIPAPKPESKPQPVAKAKPAARPEPTGNPEPESAKSLKPEPARTASVPEPEPTSAPIKILPKVQDIAKNEAKAARDVVEVSPVTLASIQTDTEEAPAETEETSQALPSEPVRPEQAPETASEPPSQPVENRGNVITRVFKFLFGWMA